MDLTEAEDVKKKWQESTENLYEKNLHDWLHDLKQYTHSLNSQK